MEINAVGIIGAAGAGAELAELFARNGLQVRLYDGFKDGLALALAKLTWSLRRGGKAELLENIEGVQDLAKFRGADLVLESVCMPAEERKVCLGKLLRQLEPGCLVGLNCAVRPLAGAIEACGLPPERTLGFNFAGPVRANQLAEIVRTDMTADGALGTAEALLRRLGKTPVIVKDNPGQIVERLALPYLLGALRLLEAGKGSPCEIDAAFREVSGAAAGPFEAADMAGLDARSEAAEFLYAALGRPERLAPSPALRRLVQYGQLGRKATVGFYLYEDGAVAGENPELPNLVKYLGLRKAAAEEIFAEIMRPVLEEAKLLAPEIMASEYDIETAARLAFGWPKGPFAYGRDCGRLLERKRVSEFDRLDNF